METIMKQASEIIAETCFKNASLWERRKREKMLAVTRKVANLQQAFYDVRITLHLSQKAFAKRLGMTVKAVKKIEEGDI